MKAPRSLEDISFLHREKGAVLVVSIWILIILVLLAISVGRRTSIELRLLRHHLARSQAFYLARAGLERIYAEKKKDDNHYDALNEDWSNKHKPDNAPEFKDFPLGNGKFTVKYVYPGSSEPLYGMQDEQSKININKMLNDGQIVNDTVRTEFIQLLGILGIAESEQAEALADKFIDWIDNDDNSRLKAGDREADDYLDKDIVPKNKPLNRLEELLMIDGFIPEMVNKLINYITIYGDGRININTAPKEALMALGFSPDEADIIIKKRAEKSIASIESSGNETLQVNNEGKVYLAQNSSIDINRFMFNSLFYKAISYGTVNNIAKEITTVVKIDGRNLTQVYWYED